MKPHLILLLMGIAYGIVLRVLVIPVIASMVPQADRGLALFFTLVAWGIAFVTTACNLEN